MSIRIFNTEEGRVESGKPPCSFILIMQTLILIQQLYPQGLFNIIKQLQFEIENCQPNCILFRYTNTKAEQKFSQKFIR